MVVRAWRRPPKRSAVAGCAFADLCMFVVMRSVVDSVLAVVPSALCAVVADDFQIMLIGKVAAVVARFKLAFDAALAAFEAHMLPVATS